MSRTKRFISKFFKIKWLNLSQLKETAFTIKEVSDKLLDTRVKNKNIIKKKQNMQKVKSNISLYYFLSVLFFGLGMGVLIYGFLNISEISFFTLISITCLSLPFFSLSFRYSFWAFQLKHNKIGCDINQWYKHMGFFK